MCAHMFSEQKYNMLLVCQYSLIILSSVAVIILYNKVYYAAHNSVALICYYQCFLDGLLSGLLVDHVNSGKKHLISGVRITIKYGSETQSKTVSQPFPDKHKTNCSSVMP